MARISALILLSLAACAACAGEPGAVTTRCSADGIHLDPASPRYRLDGCRPGAEAAWQLAHDLGR